MSPLGPTLGIRRSNLNPLNDKKNRRGRGGGCRGIVGISIS